MPIVSHSQILPPTYARPTAFDYAGNLSGQVGSKVVDALLAALLGGKFGQVPQQPTPQRPGQLQFPSGAMTPTSPDELAQIQAMGGVPSRQGGVVPMGGANGVSYRPPVRLGISNTEEQIRQAKLRQLDQETRQSQAYEGYLKGLTTPASPTSPAPAPEPPPTAPVPSGVSSDLLKGLVNRSQQGDAKSADMIRRLALEKDDPEAILILQSWGEL